MLCKCSGKYIDIYFNLKITYYYYYNYNNILFEQPLPITRSNRLLVRLVS